MYSSVHGVVGATIMLSAPNPIVGGVGAFLSHFVLDYIGESSIGDTKKSTAIESTLLLAFTIGALCIPSSWLAFIGWGLANAPDLIDKPNRWFRGKAEWFSCHNGRGLFQYTYKGRVYKLGYPTIVKATKEQTLLLNTYVTIAWLVVCLILSR